MSRKYPLLILLSVFALSTAAAQGAVWMPISSGLLDQNIHSLAAHPRNAQLLLAASMNRLFKSADGGRSWKRVFSTRGASNTLRFVTIDEASSAIYVGTDKGIQVSRDGGRQWSVFFKNAVSGTNKTFCMMKASEGKEAFYIGTADGLYVFDAAGGKTQKVSGVPGRPVHSLLRRGESGDFFAATDEGFYRQVQGNGWEKIFALGTNEPAEEVSSEEEALSQFQIEEFSSPVNYPNFIYMPQEGAVYAATRQGIWEGHGEGADWALLKGQNLPLRDVRALARSPRTFYVATSAGVYQWDPKGGTFRELYKGVDSTQVQALVYSEAGDYLAAGTTRGIFRLNHPELGLFPLSETKPVVRAAELLKLFQNEPTILEIQNAAIRYAEVHPDKIRNWRAAAARKALIPKLSLDGGMDRDQNVDIDRGGTGDPDRFIMGPEEKSLDWSVGVSWDLGDLVWTDDQTSIDVRSKLMAELREEILSQVTHFYFERRRLQAEMLLSPPPDLAVEIEKTIRLEELTANIDALTGGYWTERAQNP